MNPSAAFTFPFFKCYVKIYCPADGFNFLLQQALNHLYVEM